ncbi:YhdT family protein [Brevibacterium renqingii]|uniref:YhdT family protein n=1 Tax=Brevibacterium renqingii TaxID=2776916 RepID=UPI001ADF7C7F|nr:YhdT family protein [Brevibacterium renqingii]
MARRFNFEVDQRYRQANKEALVAFLYWVVYLVLTSVVALGLGLNRPAEDIDFILGFPAWFFYSAGVVLVVLCILPYFLVRFFYRDYSLDAEEPGADSVDESEGEQR